MELHRGYAPYNQGPNAQTDKYFGHADWHYAQSQGKSAQEIADWARANSDKFGRGTQSQAYKDIMAAAGNSSSSSSDWSSGASSYVPGTGGASLISGANQIEMPEWMSPEGADDVIRGSQVDVWTADDFVNPGININESFNTDIEQIAEVDNSFTNNFGDNNVFGAGSNIGNQNATTMINQSAKGAEAAFNMNGGYYNGNYADAKDRARNRLKLSNAVYDVA